MIACEETQFLNGKVKILSNVSDSGLSTLYKNCLLTIFPSLYEGWGLPVGKSLSSGKVCITSNVTSLPEVGGEFATYIDPARPDELAEAIAGYLDNPGELEAAEANIRNLYRPNAWRDVASRIVAGCLAVSDRPAKSALAVLEPGREYPVCLQPNLDSNLMGDRMLNAISSVRRRQWLPGLYSNEDYICGQFVRVGDGWCEPETNVTWATKNAAIMFKLPTVVKEPLVVFLSYSSLEPCIGADLIVESNQQHLMSCKIAGRTGHLVLHGLKPAVVDGEVRYVIRFKISSPSDLEAKLKEIDNRAPAIGIRSLVVTLTSDLATRLTILERLSTSSLVTASG